MSMNKNSPIYKKALQKANDVYGEKSSIYRSSYIVKTYKDLGGKMSPKRSKQRSKNRRSIRSNGAEPRKRSKNRRSIRRNGAEPRKGLLRWFKEEWVQVVPYLKDKKIIECGGVHMNKSPGKACRPLHRVTNNTPITIDELLHIHSKKDIVKMAKDKEKSPSKRLVWKTLQLK